MSANDKSLERLDELIGALREGSLSRDESDEFSRLLDTAPGAYRRLCEHMFLISALQAELSATSRTAPAAMGGKAPSLVVSRWSLIAGGALAAGLALMLFIWQAKRHVPIASMAGTRIEKTDHGVAVLTQSMGARWGRNEQLIKQGSALAPGKVELEEGIARLEFYSGATILLEGHTVLEIVSAWEAILKRGKVRAHVPYHAQGFTIRSPQVRLVDRGTEFGMIADDDAGTQVHVFQGRVELFDPVASVTKPLDVSAGAAVSVDPHLRRTSIAAMPAEFSSVQELERNVTAKSRERRQQWKALSRRLQEDPRVLAYYMFERDAVNDRVLRNASTFRSESLQGAIIGCAWADGRWPEKNALEFKRPSDRVRITIPGQHQAVTVMAWVRIDGFDNPYNSLLLSDGWYRTGSFHWQIMGNGIGELAVWPFEPPANFTPNYNNPNKPNFLNPNYDSSQPLTVYDLGRWIHLAVAYDSKAGVVTHFLDGVMVDRVPLRANVPIEIQSAQIGNWDPMQLLSSKPIRNFNGRIDEMIIFHTAVSADEVRQVFEMGKP